MSEVRVRFAPSPTGHFHIGSARTALFNWLYAQHTGGKFILRIEDTDKERNTPEALQALLDGMRWLGLLWDEGPEVGGAYGPYFQSERSELYNEYLEKLKASDRVYEKEGALFFKISGEAQVIQDSVRGTVTRAEEKDFVIFRSNGTPVFHFVNVVDDIAMGITHVIRGEDHLSNTSKHVELFKAFGAPVPQFAHIPLILKTHGPGKMSKRDQGALIDDYRQQDFLPEALNNYLCLLGWSPKSDEEILPIEEIIRRFELTDISKNNARFDEVKLSHVNAEYVRALPLDILEQKALPRLQAAGLIDDTSDRNYLKECLSIAQEKIRSIDNLPAFLHYCFKDDFEMDSALEKLNRKSDLKSNLASIHTAFCNLDNWTADTIESTIKALAEAAGSGPGPFMKGTRLATSGQAMGPSLFPLLEVLGQERCTKRLAKLIETL